MVASVEQVGPGTDPDDVGVPGLDGDGDGGYTRWSFEHLERHVSQFDCERRAPRVPTNTSPGGSNRVHIEVSAVHSELGRGNPNHSKYTWHCQRRRFLMDIG